MLATTPTLRFSLFLNILFPCSRHCLGFLLLCSSHILSRVGSQVNFIISGSTVANRRRLRNGNQQQHSRIEEAESQLYRDLAQTSGGQAAEVTTSEVSEAISVLTESNSVSLVALPNVSPQVLQRCSCQTSHAGFCSKTPGDAAAGGPQPRTDRHFHLPGGSNCGESCCLHHRTLRHLCPHQPYR